MNKLLSDAPAWPHVIVITGPTASGKSSLALEVAETLGAHIISADSRQVFRGISVTTAAPTAADLTRVPHHLVEFLDLGQYYSAAMFEADAMRLIAEARDRGDRYIVVCGGSMLYIDALLKGIDDIPTITDNIRDRVKQLYAENGLDGLIALLSNLDPEFSAKVDRANTRRVMHAVEICLQTGRPASSLMTSTGRQRPFTFSKFVIDRPRDDMFARINTRVDAMVAAGMDAEARSVFHLRHLNSLNTIGFKEWFAYFDGLMDRQTAIARIAKNTRVYAKKQLTWLARDPSVISLDPTHPLLHQLLSRLLHK